MIEYLSEQERGELVRQALKQLAAKLLDAQINLTLNRVRVEATTEGKRTQSEDVARLEQIAESYRLGIEAVETEFAHVLTACGLKVIGGGP